MAIGPSPLALPVTAKGDPETSTRLPSALGQTPWIAVVQITYALILLCRLPLTNRKRLPPPTAAPAGIASVGCDGTGPLGVRFPSAPVEISTVNSQTT